jgi:hypothetical protein
MWTHDSELEQIAQEALRAEASALAGDDATIVNATTLLEAIGTLVAMNCSPVLPLGGATLQRLEALLGALMLEELDDASVELLEHAPRAATLDPECLDEEMQPVFDALRLRDRTELVWLGAEHLKLADAISWEAAAARKAFDDCLEAQLWHLVPLGRARTLEVQWMAPTQRVRFWWRSRGENLPATALIDPRDADRVRAAFPEAQLATRPPLSRSGQERALDAGGGRQSIELDLSPLIEGVTARSGVVAEHGVLTPRGSYVLSVLRVATAKTSVLHIALHDSAAEALSDVEARLKDESAWRPAQAAAQGREPTVQIAVGDTAFVAFAVRSPSAGIDLEVQTVLAAAPTDADVSAYVATGSKAQWMARQAERDASLADRLRRSVANARKGQQVSLLARIWANQPAQGMRKAPTLEITALAAHGEGAFKERVIRLGELDPIAAEALLKIHEKAVELLVLTSAGVILDASLGGVPALADARRECWTARVEGPSWPLRLRIAATDGAVIEADLDLGSAGSD